MKILLIHNDNLNENLVNNFDEEDILIFCIANQTLLNPNFSFDKEAHEQLNDHFEESGSYDLIVLPFNLSSDNYLEFSGIQLANHIRLTKIWNHHKTPILFLGEETPAQIARLIRADILFTKGIFCTPNQTYDEISRWARKLEESNFGLSENDYGEIINKLILEPPNDYDSHHSIDNEFSLYLWSQTIELELPSLKKEVESGLYFKWWSLKNQIELLQPEAKLLESSNSLKDWSGKKVLLIDDQHEKGWYLFFKNLLPTVEVDFLLGDFQKPEQFSVGNNLVDAAIDKIRLYEPHVVLLDLRLTDTDNESDKKELSGVKILQKFRESDSLNQGIQFVSLSASNKIWNYEELLKKKVSSFIVKTTDIESSLQSLIYDNRELIYKKIEEAEYLRSIYNRLKKLEELLMQSISMEEFEIQQIQLKLVFELITNGLIDSVYNNFAYHVLYQVLEGFIKSDKIFQHDGNESYVFCNGSKVLVRKVNDSSAEKREVKEFFLDKGRVKLHRTTVKNFNYVDTYTTVISILHIRLGLSECDNKFSKWVKYNKKRNVKTGHGSNKKISEIQLLEINNFIDFLSFVFDEKNQNIENTKRYINSFNFDSESSNRTSGNKLADQWPGKK
jgi:CheY-like chemotaxis protein